MAEKFVTLDGLGRVVDRLKGGGGAGALRTLTLTVTADELAEQPVTKPLAGLGSLNLVSPVQDEDNIAAWNESTLFIQDHKDNPDVPDGSLRMICTNEPDGPITIRIATMKEN